MIGRARESLLFFPARASHYALAVRLNHIRQGSGEPLLLVHPLGSTLAVWRPVIGTLSEQRDVVAVDLPGFGGSPPLADGDPPTPAALAGALIAFCSDLGIERPHVAGNSLGGWVALEMAKAGAARSVLAISPAGLWRAPLEPRRRERQQVARRLRPLVEALVLTRRGRRLLLSGSFANPDLVSTADARLLVEGYLDSTAYRDADREMRAAVFEHDGRISVPVTIVWGGRDRVVGRPSRSRRPPEARYLEMPGWGHIPIWDDPEGVIDLLLETSAVAGSAQPGV
jgi:pimeloyl-ACP methyl ester carboxylesterase